MCDCYTAPCQGCKRGIPVHLGDFSVGRGQVTVFCPKCRNKVLPFIENMARRVGSTDPYIVFADPGNRKDRRHRRNTTFFIVEWPRHVSRNE